MTRSRAGDPRSVRDGNPVLLVGRGQAVRHETLDLAFGGSNPPAPANLLRAVRGVGSVGPSSTYLAIRLRAALGRRLAANPHQVGWALGASWVNLGRI